MPIEPPRQLVYREMFKHLLGNQIANMSARCAERLRAECGVDVTAPLRPSYPREAFDAALRVLAEEIYGELPIDQATQRIGEDAIAPFASSIVGKAILSLGKFLPLKSLIMRMPRFFRSNNSYVEATVIYTGEFSYDVIINELGAYPSYWVGMMLAGERAIGYPNAVTTLHDYDGHRGILRVRLK